MFGLIPWFPGLRLFSGRSEAGRLCSVPKRETIDGLDVRHPRAFFFPRFGYRANPMTFALSLLPAVWPLRRKVDVILGSWAFPDGIAAIQLGRWLGLPVVVKVHGSDLNVFTESESIRRVFSRKLPQADRLIAVSRPLAERARSLGVSPDRITVVQNGVDRLLFQPRDRVEARRAMQLPDGSLILYVGRLESAKGVLDLLDAFDRIASKDPTVRLALVGGGSEMPRCQAAAKRWPGRVFTPGAVPLAQVAQWTAACDVLTLPSWNEGTPNVVLEALASGRRVVATRVGGIPDVVGSPDLGELVQPRHPDELAEALLRSVHSSYDPLTVAAAGPPSWEESADRVAGVLRSACDGVALPDEARAPNGAHT